MRDSTSNNHNGTSNGNMTSGDQVAGKIDGSLNLDGNDDYIQTTSNELKTLDSFTLSVWFKADSTTVPQHILWEGPASQNGWGDGSGNPDSHEMHLTICKFDTNNTLNFFYGYEGSGSNFTPAVEIIMPFSDTTNWNHAVAVMTGAGTSPSAELFLNGVSQGTDTGTQTNRTAWDTNLRIGRPGPSQRYFDGMTDEVRILETAASASWVKASYESERDDLLDFSSEETNMEDYVDNNTSNMDNSMDKGTHSNFTAQQYGPDSINDTLTEGNTAGLPNEAMIVYGEGTNTTLRYRLWNSTDLSSELPDGTLDIPSWVVLESAPNRDEKMLVIGDDSRDVHANVWNGSSWEASKLLGSAIITSSARRGFDVAYEQTSGRCLIAVGNITSNDINYWIWNGSSWVVDGEAYNITITDSKVNWVSLASDPASNEIALIYATDSDVGGVIWNGSAWGNQQSLEDISITAEMIDHEFIAIAYEQSSGYAMFIWGADDSPTTADCAIEWRQWNGTGWENEGTPVTIGLDTYPPFYLSLKSNPTDNQIMLAVIDDALDLNTVRWNGSGWDSPVEHESTVETELNRCADVEWETASGHSGHAIVTWGGGFDEVWTRHWNGSAWGTIFDTDPYAELTDQSIHQLRRTADDKIFLSLVDDLSDLHVWKWVENDTDPYGSWASSGNGLGEIETDIASGTSNEAFMFSGDVYSDINYELDIEVQWTSVDYDETSEYLCMYGSSMGSENVTVDAWNGSAWKNLFTDLSSGWNNVSVSSYLTSSNFTVRFKGGNETNDVTQDSWNIDATLLHTWTFIETTYDYVLRANNTGNDSWEIRLKKYSNSSINRLENCTIYFHNSTDGTSSQIIIENGLYTNQTGPWYDLGDSEIIYIAMTVEANSTGKSYVYTYLEIRVPGITTYLQYRIAFEIT